MTHLLRFTVLMGLLMSFSAPAHALTHVQEVHAPNGLTAWLMEDHALPIVTVRAGFEGGGSVYDPQGKEGLAMFVAEMMDEGAGDMDSLAFHSALEGSAIRFGAAAGQDIFVVSVQSLTQYKRRALELFTLTLNAPRFDEEALQRMRAASISELKELSEDPDYVASLTWKQTAFKGHPYGRPRRGTLETMAHISRADVQDYAQGHFRCGPAIISVVGDITASEVRDWLTGLPAAQACSGHPPAIPDTKTKPAEGAPIVVQTPVPQTVVVASLPGVKHDDPQFYAVEVLNQILGGNSLTARLGKEIRDKRGLAYYAESDAATLDHAGYFAFTFASRNAKAYEALSVFNDTLRALSEKGVTQAELDDTKSYLTGSLPLQIDNQQALADYLLGMQHLHLGSDYLEKRNGFINAVTLQQVNDAARKFLSPSPLVIMVGQPEKEK